MKLETSFGTVKFDSEERHKLLWVTKAGFPAKINKENAARWASAIVYVPKSSRLYQLDGLELLGASVKYNSWLTTDIDWPNGYVAAKLPIIEGCNIEVLKDKCEELASEVLKWELPEKIGVAELNLEIERLQRFAEDVNLSAYRINEADSNDEGLLTMFYELLQENTVLGWQVTNSKEYYSYGI